MKAAPTIAFVIAALALKEVECNSAGAPSAACDSLMPNPAVGAHGADPRDTAVPYAIDYAAFDRTPNDNMLAYYPGRTYTGKQTVTKIYYLSPACMHPYIVSGARTCVHYFTIRKVAIQLIENIVKHGVTFQCDS